MPRARSARAMTACFVVSLPVKDNGMSDTWDGPAAVADANGPVSVGSAASGVVEVDTAPAPVPVEPEPIEPELVEPDPVEPEPVETEPGVPLPVVPVFAEPEAVELEPLEPELLVELVAVEPAEPEPVPPIVPLPLARSAVPGAAKVSGVVDVVVVVVVVVVAAIVVDVVVVAAIEVEVVVAGARVVVVAGAIVVVVVAAIWTTAGAPGSATIPAAGFESPRPLSRIVMVMMLPTNCAPVSPSNVNVCHAPPTTL